MGWRLIHFDDFTGYANDAAFQAAYTTAEWGAPQRVAWSATNGPGSVPGVANTIAGGVLNAHFDKTLLSPAGRKFRIKGRFDCSNPGTTTRRVPALRLFGVLRAGDGEPFTPGDTGDLFIQWSGDLGTDQVLYVGDLPTSTTHDIDMIGEVATAGNADGSFEVWVDGVLKHSESAISLGFDGIWGGANNAVEVNPGGKFTNLEIYDWVDEIGMPETGSLIDHSEPCCDTHGGASAGPVVDRVASSWQPTLQGGGTIDDPIEPTDDEDWTDQTPPKEPDSWLTIQETPYPASGSPSDAGPTEWGLKPYSDPGRLVEARLREVGAIERGSSDKNARYSPARGRFVVDDADGSIRERLGDSRRRHLFNREARYDLISYAGRKAGLDPMPVIQGRVVDVQPATDRQAVVEVQDIVGSHFGILNPDKMIGLPIGDEHENLPDETKGHIYSILLGEQFDIPARDCGDYDFESSPTSGPIQRVSAPRNLTGELIGAGSGSRTYYYGIVGLTEFGNTVMSNIVSVSGCPDSLDVDTYVQLEWDPPSTGADLIIAYWVLGRTARTPNKRLDTMNNGGTFVNPETSYRDGRQGSRTDFDREKTVNFKYAAPATAPASNAIWTWLAVALGEVPILKVFGSDLKEGGVPERVELDINGGDILTPESDDWPEGDPYRVVGGIRQTGFWARGPRVAHHRDGIVTFSCNTGGYKGTNDLLINQVFLQLYRFLNDFVEKDDGQGYRDGDFGPCETFADGRPKFHISKFLEAQNLSAEILENNGGSPGAGSPGLGFIGRIFVIEPTPLGEIIRRFFHDYGGHLTSHRSGAVYPYLIDPAASWAGSPSFGSSASLYRERQEIGRILTHEVAWAEQENRLTYQLLYSPDLDFFGSAPHTLEDADSIGAHGGDPIGVFETALKQCYYGHDAATMAARWQMELDLYSQAPRYVTWSTDLKHVQRDNGDEVRFSHRKEGVGLLGEDGTPGVLMAMTYHEQPKELLMRVRLLDAVLREAEAEPEPEPEEGDPLVADGSGDPLTSETGDPLISD